MFGWEKRAYQAGLDAGRAEGLAEGHDAGYRRGYQDGMLAGLEEARNVIRTAMNRSNMRGDAGTKEVTKNDVG